MAAVGRVLLVSLIALAAGCGSKSGGQTSVPPTTPTAPTTPATACVDTTLGVCRIADAGVRHISIARAGANGLVVDPDTGYVYVAINGVTSVWCGDRGQPASGLSIVSPAGSEVATVPTTESPVWPLVDTRRRKVYVAGSGGGGRVAIHHPLTGALEGSVVVGGRPHDLGLDPVGDLMLVSNTFDLSQTFVSLVNVSTGGVAGALGVPELPHKIVVDETRRVAYVASLGAGQITAVDLATGMKIREMSSGPIPQTSALGFSPARRRLYVGKTGGARPGVGPTIVVLDPDTGGIVGEVGTFTPASSTPTRPWGGFGIDDTNGLLYAAMGNTNFVAVVDLDALKPVGVFEVSACPWAVAVDTRRGVGYVTNNQAAALTAFDLGKVARAVRQTAAQRER